MKIQGEVPVKIDNDRYIDFLCHAADMVVEQAGFYTGVPVYDEGEGDGALTYTEWGQEVFDEAYDSMELYLNTILNVHPDIKFVGDYEPVTSNKPWGETCGGKYNKE